MRYLLIGSIAIFLLGCFEKETKTTPQENICNSDVEKQAIQNNADAQDSLGFAYATGKGCEKNLSSAFQWFEKAANQENASAQNNLGVCYATGEGVEKSPKLAFDWFQKSANKGWSEAQFNLGLAYLFGVGVDKNASLAQEWFNKASNRGIHRKYSESVANHSRKFTGNISSLESNSWVRAWALLGY